MSKKNILLLSCGSFNPVTQMHLRIFELARDVLHKTGKYNVVAGVMSPTHDAYGKKGLINSTHRLKMCELALKTSNWITFSSWETEQSEWTRTVKAMTYFQKALKDNTLDPAKHLPNDVLVKLLCGADLLESFAVPGLWADEDIETIVGDYGIVVITRAGSDPQQFIAKHAILKKHENNIHIVEEWIANEISSTKIRLALSRSESVKYLVPDPVIDYIQENHLYQA